MDKRQLAPVHALSRLVELIDRSPTVRDAARQSAAYEKLRECVAELRDFVEGFHTDVARRPLLREEVRTVRREIQFLAESIVATGELAWSSDKAWITKLRMPPRNYDDARFAIEARTLASLARESAEQLIGLGMLPGRPDHLHERAEHFETLIRDEYMLDAMIRAGKQGFPFMVERARKTARVLFLQVRPLIDEAMIAEWRQALHLGRVNRPALARPAQLALPRPQPTTEHTIGVVADSEV